MYNIFSKCIFRAVFLGFRIGNIGYFLVNWRPTPTSLKLGLFRPFFRVSAKRHKYFSIDPCKASYDIKKITHFCRDISSLYKCILEAPYQQMKMSIGVFLYTRWLIYDFIFVNMKQRIKIITLIREIPSHYIFFRAYLHCCLYCYNGRITHCVCLWVRANCQANQIAAHWHRKRVIGNRNKTIIRTQQVASMCNPVWQTHPPLIQWLPDSH